MRVRNTFMVVALVTVAVLALTPFAIGEALEPNEDTVTPGGYLLVQCFVLPFAFVGAFAAHIVRRPTWYGLTLYVVGNFVVMVAMTLALAFAAAATTVGQYFDWAPLLPLGWFILVAFRWNYVKNPEGVAANLRSQDVALRGEGNATTKPLAMSGGMTRVRYVFSGGDVTGCEIFVSNTDTPDEKRSIAMPESPE
ncbi:MAG: hypothetical protein AAF787_16595, partial [Chloroflexota bacterium]